MPTFRHRPQHAPRAHALHVKLRRARWILFAVSVLALGACTPQLTCALCASGRATTVRQYFFSSAAWGDLPFTEEEKRGAIAKALSRNEVVRLEEAVPFQISSENQGEVAALSFVALFEVDPRTRPSIRSGYVFEIDPLKTALPQRVRVTNQRTERSLIVQLRSEGR